jgi:hypothetical protein
LLRHSDLNTVIVYTVPSLEDLAGRLDAVIEAPD